MKTRIISLLCVMLLAANYSSAQVVTLSEAISNAEMRVEIVRSNAVARAGVNEEYLRLHPAEATNALTRRQLELLDINVSPAARSNYFSQYHSKEELLEFTNTVQLYLTNAAAQSSYYFHRHGTTEAAYASNLLYAMQHAPPPKPWPPASRKEEIFGRCATAMRSSFDTNQIEAACNKISLPQAAALRNLAAEAISKINMFADLLPNPDLQSAFGVRARLSTSTNIFYFDFWFKDSSSGAFVRSVEERTADGRFVVANARFYEDGKLQTLAINSTNGQGQIETDESIYLDKDGTVRNFWSGPLNVWIPGWKHGN